MGGGGKNEEEEDARKLVDDLAEEVGVKMNEEKK